MSFSHTRASNRIVHKQRYRSWSERVTVNPEVVSSIPAKTQYPENSNLNESELHRPSSKGTKLLLQVIKTIINQVFRFSAAFIEWLNVNWTTRKIVRRSLHERLELAMVNSKCSLYLPESTRRKSHCPRQY